MPKKTANDLTVEQLQEQLTQMEAERAALLQAMEERRATELAEFASDIRAQILERGYPLDEVMALLTKGRRKASKGGGSGGGYTRYADPDNPENEYSRGPLPAWMREKMIAAGYDPADKAQREEFKANYLDQVA
jgi:DNA-binding protein H-NS